MKIETHPEIHGAALLTRDGWDDPDLFDLVATAAKLAYPGVDFCDHDDLNLAVRGNNQDDVTDLIDLSDIAETDPDELRAEIVAAETR